MIAFQKTAFQITGFQEDPLASTATMPLPINCVLIGQQVYEPGRSVFSKNIMRSIFRE